MTYNMQMNYKIGFFIRSFDGDAKWLERTLPLNVERLSGYSDICVSGIANECEKVIAICDKNGVRFVPHDESAHIPTGYINQQYSKLCADQLMPDMDFIMYGDSDSFALRPCSVDEWTIDGKPYMMHTPWHKVGQATCWHAPTWVATGIYPKYEYMRRLPMVYPSALLKSAREHLELLHNMTLCNYLARVPCFSEFNFLGHYAYERRHEMFTWIDTMDDSITWPDIPFKQCWSHGDLEEQMGDHTTTGMNK